MVGFYLMFGRNCSDALELYKKAFGVEVSGIMRYGDAPPSPDFPIAEADKDLIMNSIFMLDGTMIMCADAFDVVVGDNMYVSVMFDTMDKAQKAWDTLKEGSSKVHMELAPTFFADAHGSLVDAYGISWMFTVGMKTK